MGDGVALIPMSASADDLSGLWLPLPDKSRVPLSSVVATRMPASNPSNIRREDGRRFIELRSAVPAGYRRELVAAVCARLKSGLEVPAAYGVTIDGAPL